MSMVASEVTYQPSMDIDYLGKSLYLDTDDLPLNDHIKSLKVKEIYNTITKEEDKQEVLELLSDLSRSTDGLINNELRCKIWPILLGIDYTIAENGTNGKDGTTTTTTTLDRSVLSTPLSGANLMKISPDLFLDDLKYVDLPPHKDEDQVKLDIQRSFTILNHIQSILYLGPSSYATILTPNDIENLKTKLSHLIIKLLRKYPSLNYYQGFHDIASIILLVCYIPNDKLDDFNSNGDVDEANDDYKINEELAFKMLEYLAIFHLRDYMLTDIYLTIDHLKLIPAVLEVVDEQLFELIRQTSNSFILSEGLHYDYKFDQGLSSILTIYSHDLTNINQILTLWDFSLSYNSVLINMYVYAASLITFKERIWEKLNLEEDECEFNHVGQDLVHTVVSPTSLFEDLTDSDLVKILNKAKELLDEHPIESLSNNETTWKKWFKEYNEHSVLCNSSSLTIPKNTKFTKYAKFLCQEELSDLMLKQDDEISKQAIDDATHQDKLYDQLKQQQAEEEADSLSHSILSMPYDESESSDNLLASSLTLATSITSSSLHKIKSSLLFKKLFHTESTQLGDASDDENKKVVIRNKDWLLLTNTLYKISITIGFLGIMIHFILVKYENLHYHNFLNSVSSTFRQIVEQEPIYTLSSIGGIVAGDVEDCLSNVVHYVRNTQFTSGILGHVGIGNVRNTIYGFQG
ncbi:GTPase-activating protein GYP8 [Candida viswanathii]|uniref:Oxidant-induced cell-cycle arrest protein 5 n=1 Tax=Candida viswanathii TaxID=5486 RepID=A0A367YG76_9ASCO|nr:GTPase-activating protein GYP8 [Candida viswanathii]